MNLPFESWRIEERILETWTQAWTIWLAGGWCMPAIAFVALVMFAMGMHVHLQLVAKGLTVPERTWRTWIDSPNGRRGTIGSLIEFVTGASSLKTMGEQFRLLRATEVAPFERNLRVMRVCVGAAPLLGLLGTVTGMLSTFDALAFGAGGEETMGMVAKGISEALITTETGLVIALPGLFFQYQLARRYERYKAFLAHLETVCMQGLHRRLESA